MLRESGDAADARKLLAFIYSTAIADGELTAENFLGLAESRLESGDAPGAVADLRRMVLIVGEPFETLQPAAALLQRFNRNTETLEFLSARTKAVPWDKSAAATYAVARADVQALRAAASDRDTPYTSRVEAAIALAKAGPAQTGLGSAELETLTNSAINPAAAERPYFYSVRVKAAEQTTDNAIRVRLFRGAVEIDPEPFAQRVQLFRAALGTNRNVLATSIMNGPESGRYRARAMEDEADPSPNRYQAMGFLSNRGLTPAERASIARELGVAYRKLDRLSLALHFLRIAYSIEPSSATKAEFDQVEQEQRIRGTNKARRPAVSESIDQGHPVRPRLMALAGGAR
jgi:tetratricopeptide (TPR) repeat protein